MVDRYLMDGHKLNWHYERVNEWLKGERIAPLHIDVGLSKGCNIKCHYCFGQLQGNKYSKGKNVIFPREALLKYMEDAGKVGVKSMAIIGEAEPTLNSSLYDAIIKGAESGVDMALGTNGILFEPTRDVLRNLVWIRFNISAASEMSYRKLHSSKNFSKVAENVLKTVKLKKENNLGVTVGLQMVLTPKDIYEAIPLAKLGKEWGVDYFVIKQCSDTLESDLGVTEKYSLYKNFEDTLREAELQSTDDYDVTVKWNKIREGTSRDYENCFGAPFLLYSAGDGRLFPCGSFFNPEYWDDFLMGDLTKDSFIDILKSERYWDVVKRVEEMGIIKTCYAGCKSHKINSYLWKLKEENRFLDKPDGDLPPHVNFI